MNTFPPPRPGLGRKRYPVRFYQRHAVPVRGALFVAPAFIGKGIGRALLNHVQQHYPYLTPEVYQKNVRAVNFYHAQGFRIEDSARQDDTQHPTWIMSWQADQTP